MFHYEYIFLRKDLSVSKSRSQPQESERPKIVAPYARFSTLKQAPQETPTSEADSPDSIPSTLGILSPLSNLWLVFKPLINS